jgi:RimJ/RimL family protein N-acetyltransferase
MERVTARLRLREFVEGDWEAVLAYQSDPRYLRYYTWDSRTAEEAQAFVGMFLAQQVELPRVRFQLAVEDRASGRLIGNCGIRQRSASAHDAELGYELAPAWWGRGLATEAAGVMLHFAFEDLGLRRVEAHCLAENRASARVLEKLGFHEEGRLREKECFKGRCWDLLIFGLLAAEWRSGSGRRPIAQIGSAAP